MRARLRQAQTPYTSLPVSPVSGKPGQCPLSSLCMAECEMILLKTGKFLRKEYRKEWVFTHLGVGMRRRSVPHLGKYCSVENGGIITWLVLLV